MRKTRTPRTRKSAASGLTLRTHKGFTIETLPNEKYNIYTSEKFTSYGLYGTLVATSPTLKEAKVRIDLEEQYRGKNSEVAIRCNTEHQYIGETHAFLMFFRKDGTLWVNINGRKEFAVINAVKKGYNDVVYALAPNDYSKPTVYYRTAP